MLVPWEDLELFSAIATERSFSAAARKLGLTQPTVSRRVHALEERLGVGLFVRDAEGARLSDQALELLPTIERMARLAEGANRAFEKDEKPKGEVHVAACGGAASELSFYLAREWRKAFPLVGLKARFVDSDLAFERGQVDIWLGPGEPRSALSFLRLTLACGAFASKHYARRLERKPNRHRHTASELDFVTGARGGAGRAKPAESSQGTTRSGEGRKKTRLPLEPAFVTESFEHQLRACEMGLGVMILPRLTAVSSPQGALVELDIDIEIPPVDIIIAEHPRAENVRAVRALMQQMEELLGAEPSVVLRKESA